MKTFLGRAQQLGELRLFDLQFARHMSEINGNEVPELLLAAALASNSISQGDTCLALETVGSSALYKSPDLRSVRQKLPPIDRWRRVLLEQKVVCLAPKEGLQTDIKSDEDEPAHKESENSRVPVSQLSPLVLDEKNRLYLARYWVLEQSLAGLVNCLLDREPPDVDVNKLKDSLNKLFAESDSVEPDWQKTAVANAVISNFCVITGGPGTGKTYTVTALLAALMEQGVEPRKIALAAPTGKASTRLTQSIQKDLSGLLNKLSLPEASFESVTLHKLIGARPGRVRPMHHAQSPLLYDVVIIDEASMIDLPMMARTFDALADDARIVLIGDKDQLHSVESGMVLGDICGARSCAELSRARCQLLAEVGINNLPAFSMPGGRIADHIIYLEKSHRVQDDGGISALAAAVNNGNVEAAFQKMLAPEQPNLSLLPHDATRLDTLLREHAVPSCKETMQANTPLIALERMAETGVLCALRHGRTGAIRVNAQVENLLRDDGVIPQGQTYYHGRPLMIVENSSHQRLHNGDHGLVLTDKNNATAVYFASENSEDGVRVISHTRLPRHETFYAMTIHKSQGSEYSTVIIVLPEADSPILSRELLYTAITRARNRVIILANNEQLRRCIEKRSVRQSGLQEMFWTEAEVVSFDTVKPEVPEQSGLASESVKEAPVVSKPASVKKEKPTVPVQQTLDF